ncbi:hypothetical protein RJ639_046705, partial [Escallonia herrerae]
MKYDSVRPVVYNFTYLLKVCGDSADLVRVMNSLISMYSKCKKVDIAAKLFEDLPFRTLVSWNAMILGYAQNGHITEALNHF